MNLHSLERDIVASALRRIRAHESYARGISDENKRRQRRSLGAVVRAQVQRPEVWTVTPGHNPYHVRSRAAKIARSIRAAVEGGYYKPRPPAGFTVPKSDGTSRTVSTFEIADEAVSAQLFHSLSRKNRGRFSSHSYAYRPGITAHDAITNLSQELSRRQRLFVAEFDFSKFFDKIDHNYLRTTFREQKISATPIELRLVESFLASPWPKDASDGVLPAEARTVGVPQGTSVSLFLANLAATPLDRSLERLGVGFARYADDTVIWSDDYRQINLAVTELQQAAKSIGAEINFPKSPGVRLLVPEGTEESEMRSTTHVPFLGHDIRLDRIGIKSGTVDRIKTHLRKLVYDNLLREPLRGTLNVDRLRTVDWDYVVLVSQLRRYLYGSLSEREVRSFRFGQLPTTNFEGLMSFFPLVDDDEQLSELDDWLVTEIWLALRKRARLAPISHRPHPWRDSRRELISTVTSVEVDGRVWDIRIPSFVRISRILRLVIASHGTSSMRRDDSYLYD